MSKERRCICPKAKECKEKDCRGNKPHKYADGVCNTPKLNNCPLCIPYKPTEESGECVRCKGKGFIYQMIPEMSKHELTKMRCDDCKGTGKKPEPKPEVKGECKDSFMEGDVTNVLKKNTSINGKTKQSVEVCPECKDKRIRHYYADKGKSTKCVCINCSHEWYIKTPKQSEQGKQEGSIREVLGKHILLKDLDKVVSQIRSIVEGCVNEFWCTEECKKECNDRMCFHRLQNLKSAIDKVFE